jgi:hypothetical protein
VYREGRPLRRRGELEQFIDRPLVEGVDAVLAGQHLPPLVDQDVRPKPEAPAGGTGRHPGRRSRARGTRQHRPSTGANARGSSTARGEASTPNFLQLLIRVRHHIERQITSVGPQFVRRGVKQHHLVNGGRRDLAVPGNHRLQMHTADWAAREAPELQGSTGRDREPRRHRPRW